MKAIVSFVVFAFAGSPLMAVAVAVMRAPESTIDKAITILVLGLFVMMAGAGVYAVLAGAARIREAQHARPSHQITMDRREQYIDARSVRLIGADGQQIPVELPAGAMMEVIR